VIHGRVGVFLVVWVDLLRGVADLIPVDQGVSLEEDVPFAGIQQWGK